MKLGDYIDFSAVLELVYNDFLPLDDNHKSYEYDDEIPLQDDTEAFLLIKQAKNSFLSHKKIKDKYIKPKCEWDEIEYSCKFYLSTDRKFYCVYFCYCMDYNTFYFYGIIEKKTGKHLIISYREDRDNIDLAMNHHMFNYEWDYIEHDDLRCPSVCENDPLELICYLEDQFKIFYKEMCINDNDNDDNDNNSE
ncbi:hypothetical protein H012_gp026 [Acanthamoeba polyphaga moumouvirus]|uniref:Uncharacterized protein n=1 Tax=Acanthamoeba polyphaga moumouvirus TaxID=1269028 RepID=L7RDJ6_9VIRU|nr:hypothetical protein H012_gp026 [Acanthamoeba polyphaga moumouvirus]AGC02422.1 hypothetical protein Moumou_00907 [Acanthamoeba polyphaga moumouvirus]